MVPGTLEIMALGRPFGFFGKKQEKKERSNRAMAISSTNGGGSSSAQLKTAADTNTYDHAKTHT